ncbi:MAG: VCBS repeat-containing protein [Cryobacterium sp.]|nr:VCBS repeat-containing protein [Cryobacterium sp.]
MALILAIAVVSPAMSASAVSGADFDPGNIISDSLFYDASAMTEAEIQSFLNGQIGQCSNGLCLNVLTQDTYDRAQDRTICNAYTGAANEPVSRVIFKVQKACEISAKVILVTLQKEMGLVTSKAPTQWSLDHAMGYACPDTAPCDSSRAGFYNQIYLAAWQFKRYSTPTPWGNYQPGLKYIQYSPNASCGGTNVKIKNNATAALYNYTPYQPNAASLASYPTVGDSCSSYGNRNFWFLYNIWFGNSTDTKPKALANSEFGEPLTYLVSVTGPGELMANSASESGTLSASAQIGENWQSMTQIFSAGDFNGDGFADLIARDRAGDLWLFPRDGAGGWLTSVRIGTGWGPFTWITGIGDFNGDGRADALALLPSGELRLYPGNGAGGWFSRIGVATNWTGIVSFSQAGDINADGNQDVLAVKSNGQLVVYFGNGSGGVSGSKVLSSNWQNFVSTLGGPDLTGDGRPDVVALDQSGKLWLYPATEAGLSSEGQVLQDGWAGQMPLYWVGDFSVEPTDTGTPPPSGTVNDRGDWDGDGHSDVLARDSAGKLYLYPGDGSGGWLPRKQIGTGWSVFTAIFRVGDWDGDGYPDVMARDSAGRMYLYPGNGSGGWLPKRTIGYGWAPFTAVFGAGDWDGDGFPDVMARDSAGRMYLYPGNGSGGWLPKRTIGYGWAPFTAVFGAGDWDGDGFPDVMARDSAGRMYLYPGNGSGGWLAKKTYGTGWSRYSIVAE